MDWQALSTGEHAQKRFRAALLPIGTLEAHDGGPVGTDNFIPGALCEHLSDRLGLPVLPLMPYGLSTSLQAYPGGCSLTAEALESFLFALGRSLHRNGLRELIIINGHGGNTEPLARAAAQLHAQIGLFLAIIDWWRSTEDLAGEVLGPGGMGHAAIDELGLLAGLRPDLAGSIPRESVPSHFYYSGLKTYPIPRPVITYGNPQVPVDLSRLTPEGCAQFAHRVTDHLENMIRGIQEGWQQIPTSEG
jgi:creatinine amidohydrolase/Fe(II)-dependent formamide hydrolase-like protein